MKKKQLLTKLQRYTAYCIMLQKAEDVIEGDRFRWDGFPEGDVGGMCWMILGMGVDNSGFYKGLTFHDTKGCRCVIENHFPELHKKEPFCRWPYKDTPGWQFRRKALIQCIKETHP